MAKDALQYLDYAEIYARLDSNIPYLKSPPKSWQQSSTDVLAALDAIKRKVGAGFYKSQYDFDAELIRLARTVNEFHFNLVPGVLGSKNWAWSLPETLTSFSTDGSELPKVYVYNDIMLAGNQSNLDLGWEPAPISVMGDKPVLDYLIDQALDWNTVGVGESHTEWNIMMRNIPYTVGSGSTKDESLFTVSQFYRGEYLSGTFENGTEFTWNWVGNCQKDMKEEKWTSPQSIYDTVVLKQKDSDSSEANEKRSPQNDFEGDESFLVQPEPEYIPEYPYHVPFVPLEEIESTTSTPPAVSSSTVVKKVPFESYPTPHVLQESFGLGQGVVSGYLFTEDSVAVISIPSFELGKKSNLSTSFAEALSNTLIAAKEAGIKTIVVDVSGNGGGTAFQGYEAFKRIFPDKYPFQLTRAQATIPQNIVGSVLDIAIANKNNVVDKQTQEGAWNIASGYMALSSVHKYTAANDSSRFNSWEDFFGPASTTGQASSNNISSQPFLYDFADATLCKGMGLQSTLFGFGNNTIPPSYPRYSSSSIILLTDGFCGSTCAVFADLMKSIGSVKVVSVGGTPTYGPMQSVGGTRGGNVWGWDALDGIVSRIRKATDKHPKIAASLGLTEALFDQLPRPISQMRYSDNGNRINILDIVRPGDKSLTSWQFAYDPADCRLFYTRDMILDQSKVWLAAAKIATGDFGACVKGSTAQKDAGLKPALLLESPGFENSFQAARQGGWRNNATWGAGNGTSNSSAVGGSPNSTYVSPSFPFTGAAGKLGGGLNCAWAMVLGALAASILAL